jgi:hypothetical protein
MQPGRGFFPPGSDAYVSCRMNIDRAFVRQYLLTHR